MTPLKIELQSFLAFSNKIQLDFELLSKNYLFMITGATGSGKSSIFDAICFALFGKTSTPSRPVSKLKNQLSPDDMICYVKLSFRNKGKIYSVYRELSNNVRLTMPDRTVITGEQNVTDKITEIIGMDLNLFTKTVLLPQDEFRKLITADQSEQQLIFKKIVGLNHFEFVQNQLSEADRQSFFQMEHLKKLEMELVNQFEVSDNSATSKQQHLDQPDVDLVLDEMGRLNIILNAQLADLKSKINQINNRASSVSMDEAVAFNKRLQDFDNARNLLITLFNAKENQQQRKDKIKQLQSYRDIKSLDDEYTSVKTKWQEISRSLTDLKLDQPRIEEILNQITDEYNYYQHIQSKLTEKIAKVSHLKDQIILWNAVESHKKAIDFYEQTLHSLLTSREHSVKNRRKAEAENYLHLISSAVECCLNAEKANKDCSDALNIWSEANQQNMDNQAFFFAQKLKPGVPCPVCGSVEHPNLARMSKYAVTKKRVNTLHDRYLQAKDKKAVTEQKAMESLENLYREGIISEPKRELLIPVLKATQKVILKYEAELDSLPPITENYREYTLENFDFEISKYQDLNKKEHADLEAKLIAIDPETSKDSVQNELTKDEAEIAENNAHFLETEKKYLNIQALYNKNKLAADSKKQQLEECSAQLSQIKKKQDECLIELNLKREDLPKLYSEFGKLPELIKEGEQFDHDFHSAQQLVTKLRSECENKSPYDLNQLKKDLEKKRTLLPKLENDYQVLLVRSENNKKVWEHLKKIHNEYSAALAVYQDVHKLYEVASGNGTAGLSFEQKLLCDCFNQVRMKANVFLREMTSGRYEFILSDYSKNINNNQSIEILDIFSGKARPAASLSGGEIFEASFALSLGLSSCLSAYNENIDIDTLFIDEGFGNLDSLSLDCVFQCIDSLRQSGLTIGIISHVDELKENIPIKAVISSNKGSTSIKIIQ